MFGLTPDQQAFLIKIISTSVVLVALYAFVWCTSHEHLLYKYAHISNL
jgi:hypothetical protein